MENEKEMQAQEKQLATLPQNDVVAIYKSASSLKLTPEETTLLLKNFPEEQVEIRPDGHIYIPQAYYRDKLNQVLGIGQWGLVPKNSLNEQRDKSTKVFVNAILVIRGCFVAEAVGEGEVFDDNTNQSLASAWESAKSDAITRCCKDLSIGRQIYEPSYVRAWQEKHAVAVWVEKKNKPQWRKKIAEPFFNEKGPVISQHNTSQKAPSDKYHPDNTKRWLNKTRMYEGKEMETPEWHKITSELKAGKTTFAIIASEFKLNRVVREELEKIQIDWKMLLDSCKSPAQVDELALLHKERLEADALLYKRFKERKAQLAQQKSAA